MLWYEKITPSEPITAKSDILVKAEVHLGWISKASIGYPILPIYWVKQSLVDTQY